MIYDRYSEGNPTFKQNVFLVTKQGNVYLPSQTVKDAELFNKYIQTSVGTLVIEKDNRLSNIGSILFESCFVVIGFATIYLGFAPLFSVETYIFDQNASTITIKKRGIRVKEVTERSLSEVSEVKLETIYGENDTLYEVCLLMDEGDRLSLGGSSNQKEPEKMADLIRSYLKARSNSKNVLDNSMFVRIQFTQQLN